MFTTLVRSFIYTNIRKHIEVCTRDLPFHVADKVHDCPVSAGGRHSRNKSKPPPQPPPRSLRYAGSTMSSAL